MSDVSATYIDILAYAWRFSNVYIRVSLMGYVYVDNPWYDWTIVENGVKPQSINLNSSILCNIDDNVQYIIQPCKPILSHSESYIWDRHKTNLAQNEQSSILKR